MTVNELTAHADYATGWTEIVPGAKTVASTIASWADAAGARRRTRRSEPIGIVRDMGS